MCFSAAAFLRERPWQHELGLEHRARSSTIRQASPPSSAYRVLHLALHLGHDLAGVALVPVPVEVFGHGAELDDQVVGEIFGLDLASLFAPKPNQAASSSPMMIAGIGAADKGRGD